MSNPIDSFVICNAKIEHGWRFSTADFSCIACGKNKAGIVRFIREPSEVDKWHQQSDELKESDDCPPLYVVGEGMTFEEAIMNANLAAAHAKPISI